MKIKTEITEIIELTRMFATMEGMSFTSVLGQSISSSFQSAAAAIGLTAAQLGTLIGIAAGVAVLYAVLDAIVTTAEEARENLDALKDEYEDNATELENVNSELEATNQQISELKAKGTLTFTEEKELETLRAQNTELERQKALLETTQGIKAQEQNEAFVETMDKTVNDGTYGQGHSLDWVTSQQLAQYEVNLQKIAYLDEKYANDLANETYTKQREKLVQQNEDIISDVTATYDNLADIANGISYISEPTTEADREVNEWLDYVNNLGDRLMILTGTSGAEKLVFNRLIEGTTYGDTTAELKELGEQGKVTAEQLDDDKYAEFVDTLQELGVVSDDDEEALQQIAKLFNELQASEESVVEETKWTEQSLSDLFDSVSSITSEFDTVQSAVSAQTTGKSIDLETYESLVELSSDYADCLEYQNGSIQLNIDKVNELVKARAEEETTQVQMNKALQQANYLENAKQIQKYRDQLKSASYAEGETAESIQSSIDALLSKNSAIAESCAQYDLLSASIQEAVGAYQNWLNAQSASDYGEMADETVSALQQIQDTLINSDSDIYGQIGSVKFDAAVDFAVPDSVDKDDVAAIESWMNDFTQYLNLDDDGNIESLNIDQFLDKAVEAGLMNYDGEDTFTIAGQKSMEDFAEGLNMSAGMVQAFFDEMQLYGGEFSWADEATKTIGDMAVEAYEAAEALRSIEGNENLEIVLDVSEFEDATKACETLDDTIAEMNSVKNSVDVDASQVEYANSVIEYCVAQEQLLTAPAIMSVDTSKLTGDLGTALTLLQEFQTAQNTLEVQMAVGADTSTAQANISALVSEIQGLSPEILATLGLSDTSTAADIQAAISSLSADAIITLGVDSSLVGDYQSSDITADGSVIWDNDAEAVASFIAETRVAYGTVVWSNSYSGYSGSTSTKASTSAGAVTSRYRVVAAQANGTAHASGTANVSGDWRDKSGGRTLVGELGREIVVDPHTGRWYTVGDNGAEFVDIPKGSIVFNHLQSESLLKNGYVAGRAAALINGTAAVTGHYKRYSSSSKSSKKGSGSSGSSGSSSSSSSSSDDSEIVDWIEIAIDRIERAIDNLSTIASSAFRTLSERLSATNDEIAKTNYEISVQQSGYDRYIKQANSVGLSADLMEKVQNGTIDITEYDKDTANLISDYQQWYEKALDCKDAIVELTESLSELYQSKFDTVADDYENQLSLLEHLTNTYNNGIDDIEARGYLATTKYYEAMRAVESENITVQEKELSDLSARLEEAVNSGTIKAGSEAWYEMTQKINEVKEAIQESETEIVELNNSIREVEWDHFDYLQEQISNITDEADFLIDLMENSDLYSDNGSLTDTGMATMGLHGQNYNVYMAQADKYAEELLELNKEIATDPYNTTLLDRRQELLESQQDAILAAEDEKQAIVDMVEDGINLELDALKDLIDEYEDSLDSEKDLFEYQKKVKEQTEEISSLQKQLSAYSGDDSEETRATIQKLQVDLSDAVEDLEETQYDQYISETKKVLNNLYTEYETILNERLDNVDALLSDMVDTINANSASISETLQSVSSDVGYTISENLRDIWPSDGAIDVVSEYGESASAQFTSINNTLSGISAKIDNMIASSNRTAQTTVRLTASDASTVSSVTTTAYKKGGLADYTGMAWLDGTPSEPEMVLNPEDTANFIELKDVLQSIAEGGGLLENIFDSDGSSDILDKLAEAETPSVKTNTSVGDVTYQVTIPIDHVQDYEDFVNQMRKDGKFEQMIQSMTVDRLAGGSRLAKNKYQW